MPGRQHRPKRPGGPSEVWPARPPARPAAGLLLLIGLPIGVGLAGLRIVELWHDAAGDAVAMVAVGALLGLAVGAAMAQSLRTNPRAPLGYALAAMAGVLAAWGVDAAPRNVLHPISVPIYVALPLAAFVTALLTVGIVVALLWQAGYLTFRTQHRAWLWLRESRDGHGAGDYQIVCDCSWRSETTISAEEPDAEERAFEVARGHCRRVMPDIQISL